MFAQAKDVGSKVGGRRTIRKRGKETHALDAEFKGRYDLRSKKWVKNKQSDHIESNLRADSAWRQRVTLPRSRQVRKHQDGGAIASIIHGISTTAAGTLGSAELSIQQAITATANGNDRQTLLLTIDRRILPL